MSTDVRERLLRCGTAESPDIDSATVESTQPPDHTGALAPLSTRIVVAMEAATEEHLMQILAGIRYGNEIAAAARAHGLDPKLLAAVAAQETGGPGQSSGNNVVGDGGHGHGLFQIDDRSWAFARTAAALDPAANADEAASILADDLGRYGGDVHEALSAYNAGSPTATGTKTTWGDGATLGYADSVLRHYAELCGGTPAAASAGPPALPEGGAPAGSFAALGALALGAPAGGTRSAALADTLARLNLSGASPAAAMFATLAPPTAATLAPPTAATPTQTAWRSWTSLDAGTSDPSAQADQLTTGFVDTNDADDPAE